MKYQIASAQKPKSKFNMNKAIEGLTESYQKLNEAYEGLSAAEGFVAEVAQVMEDCGTALASIKQFGIAKENMSLLNGSNHALDDALGLEHLDIAAIESLSKETKEAIKTSYVKALEGNDESLWDKFINALKNMWEWIKRFFTELFDRNAKYARIVKESSASYDKLDANAQFKAVTADKLSKLCDACAEIIKAVNANAKADIVLTNTDVVWPEKAKLEPAGIKITDGKLVVDNTVTAPAEGSQTVKSLGYVGKAKAIAAKYEKLAISSEVQNTFKQIDAAYSKTIKELKAAKDANTDDIKDKQERAKEKLSKINNFVTAYAKLTSTIGSTLTKLASLTVKETK